MDHFSTTFSVMVASYMDQPERESQEELGQARDALADAFILRDGGGTPGAVVNRLYYAAFHAAQAVLYLRGINPGSHGHVRQAFGQSVVLAGDAQRSDGELLGRLYDYRHQADYGRLNLTVDITELFGEVEEFVERMEALVEKNVGSSP